MQKIAQAIVLGAGVSGWGAARLLVSEGTAVTVLDARPVSEWPLRDAFEQLPVTRCGQPDAGPSDRFDLAVVSPGFAHSSVWVKWALQHCKAVISELELGWSRCRASVIAVTGSNGKSTTVKWITESLQQAGLTAVAAGNYGYSACEAALTHPSVDWWVLEVSSFQLETVQAFRPDIAVLLNILPNHLDRHGTMDAYAAMKARIFSSLQPPNCGVAPSDWLKRMQTLSKGKGRWVSFGQDGDATYRVEKGQVLRENKVCLDARGTLFGSPAMAETLGAVAAVLQEAQGDASMARKSALAFQPLPFRMQFVAEHQGVRYLNDSKSTNLAATAHAIRMIAAPVRLIAGGLAKAEDFNSLKELLVQHVQTVYLIGSATDDLYAAWSSVVPCRLCGDLSTAVQKAASDARSGEVVLLSPGCASFDQFKNYQERGEHFNRQVVRLTGRELK